MVLPLLVLDLRCYEHMLNHSETTDGVIVLNNTVIRIQTLGLFTVTWIGPCYAMCINAIHSNNQCFIMESTNSGSGKSRFKPIWKVIGVLILRWVFNKMQVLFISDINFHGLVLNFSQGPLQIQLSSKW